MMTLLAQVSMMQHYLLLKTLLLMPLMRQLMLQQTLLLK
jgi:hypothetical protein